MGRPRVSQRPLTLHQMQMLAQAAEFVLAGEWPWERPAAEEAIETYEQEVLESAARKLRDRIERREARRSHQ